MRRAFPASLAITGFCAAVAACLLIHDLLVPADVDVPPASATAPPQPATALPGPPALPNPKIYAALAARPLFSATRRPPPVPVAAAAPAAGPAPPDFALVGVINAPDRELALVLEAGAPAATLVRPGGTVDGWTVTKIGPSSITVQAGQAYEVIKIVQ
jgi:general secretion pathway protein N